MRYKSAEDFAVGLKIGLHQTRVSCDQGWFLDFWVLDGKKALHTPRIYIMEFRVAGLTNIPISFLHASSPSVVDCFSRYYYGMKAINSQTLLLLETRIGKTAGA
jgi:hypothetical protein